HKPGEGVAFRSAKGRPFAERKATNRTATPGLCMSTWKGNAMSLAQAVFESLPRHAGKVLSRDADAALTGEQLLAACRAAAGKLSAATSGRMVGLLLPNGAGYPAALLGALWAGKVAVPLNPMLKPNELDFLLRDAAIDTVVVAEPTRSLVA